MHEELFGNVMVRAPSLKPHLSQGVSDVLGGFYRRFSETFSGCILRVERSGPHGSADARVAEENAIRAAAAWDNGELSAFIGYEGQLPVASLDEMREWIEREAAKL